MTWCTWMCHLKCITLVHSGKIFVKFLNIFYLYICLDLWFNVYKWVGRPMCLWLFSWFLLCLTMHFCVTLMSWLSFITISKCYALKITLLLIGNRLYTVSKYAIFQLCAYFFIVAQCVLILCTVSYIFNQPFKFQSLVACMAEWY